MNFLHKISDDNSVMREYYQSPEESRIMKYLDDWKNYDIKVVYSFKKGNGGIGDYLKYFTTLLHVCMEKKYKLYFLMDNDTFVKQYLFTRYEFMTIHETTISKETNQITTYEELINLEKNEKYNLVGPFTFYIIKNIEELFYDGMSIMFSFSNLVTEHKLVKEYDNLDYISLHIRLGDKFLETDKKSVICVNDDRCYRENIVLQFLENHKNQTILLFCDNKSYKEKLKEKYSNLLTTPVKVAHSSLVNTTKEEIFDTIIEFYLLTKSKKIYTCTNSGFPYTASFYGNIPYIRL